MTASPKTIELTDEQTLVEHVHSAGDGYTFIRQVIVHLSIARLRDLIPMVEALILAKSSVDKDLEHFGGGSHWAQVLTALRREGVDVETGPNAISGLERADEEARMFLEQARALQAQADELGNPLDTELEPAEDSARTETKSGALKVFNAPLSFLSRKLRTTRSHFIIPSLSRGR